MLLCWLGIHRWRVNVPEHALSVLRNGRVIKECSRCGVWRQMTGDC